MANKKPARGTHPLWEKARAVCPNCKTHFIMRPKYKDDVAREEERKRG